MMSVRTQQILLAWTVLFAVAYVLALAFLLDMIPPPPATLSAHELADWYSARHTSIGVGAVVSSICSGFMLPLSTVIAVQLARIEGGWKVWPIAALGGGVMTSIPMVLPPLFWGAAAYTPSRDAQITALAHEIGTLIYVSVVPYYLFLFVAVIVFCLRKPTAAHSPFPRWFGYLTAWIALMFEAGPIAFLTKTGLFAWDGLLAFWIPFILVIAWLSAMIPLLANALRHQAKDLVAAA
jgi:hypothetical protein